MEVYALCLKPGFPLSLCVLNLILGCRLVCPGIAAGPGLCSGFELHCICGWVISSPLVGLGLDLKVASLVVSGLEVGLCPAGLDVGQ